MRETYILKTNEFQIQLRLSHKEFDVNFAKLFPICTSIFVTAWQSRKVTFCIGK